MTDDNEYWFLPKRYGYGAGLPIVWQGWALIAGYLVTLGLCAVLIEWDAEVGGVTAALVLIVASVALMIVAARKTRGGWRWRWGSRD